MVPSTCEHPRGPPGTVPPQALPEPPRLPAAGGGLINPGNRTRATVHSPRDAWQE